MGHSISGLVCNWRALADAAASPWVVAPLAQGFGLGVSPDDYVQPGSPLPEAVARLVSTLSKTTRVAFVATDYFGGEGHQAAGAWGQDTASPYVVGSGSINTALRYIGAMRGDASDEFEAVGLDWFRSNEDWIEFAANGKLTWQREPRSAPFAAWSATRNSH
jgi:hypothetical protein